MERSIVYLYFGNNIVIDQIQAWREMEINGLTRVVGNVMQILQTKHLADI